MNGFGLELLAGFMQVDFLLAELKRGAPAGERFPGHAEHLLIEGTGALDGSDRQNQMIDPGYGHSILPERQNDDSLEQNIGSLPKKGAELAMPVGTPVWTGL
jgi:hypothetical protein